MRKRVSLTGESALSMLGVLLILVIAKLGTPAHAGSQTRVERVRAFLARRVLDAISVIGWTVDRLSGIHVERGRSLQINATRVP